MAEMMKPLCSTYCCKAFSMLSADIADLTIGHGVIRHDISYLHRPALAVQMAGAAG